MDSGAGGPASHTAGFLRRLVRKTPWASLVAQAVKNLPAMQKAWVKSPGWEDPLEEGMATHSSILAWRIPMDREAWQATVYGVSKSGTWLGDYVQHSARKIPRFPMIKFHYSPECSKKQSTESTNLRKSTSFSVLLHCPAYPSPRSLLFFP